jgi:hypothetical protein
LPSPARIGPNPATDKLDLQLTSLKSQRAIYSIYNSNGMVVKQGVLTLSEGRNNTSIPLQTILPGTYQLQVAGVAGEAQPISFRFVKH